jgi:hypothetical protein
LMFTLAHSTLEVYIFMVIQVYEHARQGLHTHMSVEVGREEKGTIHCSAS